MRNIINKARVLQDRIESKLCVFPVLSLRFYLFFVGSVFLLTGIGLFFYGFVMGVDPWRCQPLSCCFFYFIIGFLTFIIYFVMFFVLPRYHV